MKNSKIKIVIDTNVFIHGIVLQKSYKEDSDVINILLDLLEKDIIELVFSQDTIGELVYVLKNIVKHKVKNISKRKMYMYQVIMLFFEGYSVNTVKTIAPTCNDVNDNMFLECAVESKAKYLISDDLKSRMGKVKLPNTMVLTAKEFIDKYNKINQAEEESAVAIEDDIDNKDENNE
jgi:putative PIN family toxin of toxin-antitoxin system